MLGALMYALSVFSSEFYHCLQTQCNGIYPPSISHSQKLLMYIPSIMTRGWSWNWQWKGLELGTYAMEPLVLIKEISWKREYMPWKHVTIKHATKKVIHDYNVVLQSITTCFQIQAPPNTPRLFREHHWRFLTISYGVAIGGCSSFGACGATQLPNWIDQEKWQRWSPSHQRNHTLSWVVMLKPPCFFCIVQSIKSS